MKLFRFKPTKETAPVTPIWRNKEGKIACPGIGLCPSTCTEDCPIHCQTIALEAFMQKSDCDLASAYLKKAVAIAPDFKDAWNNLGSVYGSDDNHAEAYKAFKAAYSIDNTYARAIIGIIISSKKLEKFDEALRFCDKLAELGHQNQASKYRQDIREQQAKQNINKQESSIQLAAKIIAHARQTGFMGQNDNIPNIPELLVQAEVVCGKIMRDLMKGEDKGTPMVWLAWCAFAGIGAVQHWNLDWDSLKRKGIAETLLEPRGSFAMDEYVLELIGIDLNSEEGRKFQDNLYRLTAWTISTIMNQLPPESVPTLLQSMYIFGMVLQMERLGMR